MEMIYALPIFGLLVLVEFLYGHFKRNNTYHDVKDTAASLSLGLAQVAFTVVLSSSLLAVDYWFYAHRIHTFGNTWYALLLLFLLMEFSFYWWHRASHRVRFLWANHVNHHSSTEYNFSTALRQPVFSPILRPLFYFYLPWLGFDPQMMIVVSVVSLIWGVLSHTKHVGKLGFLEYILSPLRHIVFIMAATLSTSIRTMVESSSFGTFCSVHTNPKGNQWSSASPPTSTPTTPSASRFTNGGRGSRMCFGRNPSLKPFAQRFCLRVDGLA